MIDLTSPSSDRRPATHNGQRRVARMSGTTLALPPPSLTPMRAVRITRFGGPEVLDVVDVPEPTPGDGQRLYDVSTAGINFADTHH